MAFLSCRLVRISLGVILSVGWFSPAWGAKPLRIVSAAPSVTEILFELNQGNNLVGVTDSCDYPSQVTRIAHIGKFNQPNLEKILSLQPTVLITADANLGAAGGTLEKAGIQVLGLHIKNFAQLFEGIEQIGKATGSEAQARALVTRLQGELAAVSATFQNQPRAQRPLVFVELWSSPLTSAGQASFLNEVIDRAGGVSVTRGLTQDYPTVNPEDVIDWNPDYILLCSMQPSSQALHEMENRIGWRQIKAVKNHRIIYGISSDYLLRPGPRLVLGVKLLAQRLQAGKGGGDGRKK